MYMLSFIPKKIPVKRLSFLNPTGSTSVGVIDHPDKARGYLHDVCHQLCEFHLQSIDKRENQIADLFFLTATARPDR